ncbi:MAG: O-acetylhomoserine aminocarboxypropyltransferase/cysteine synthase family protein [Salinivenus sp.]
MPSDSDSSRDASSNVSSSDAPGANGAPSASAAAREFGFETRMLHAGHVPDAETGSRAVPIYQTTSYVFDDTDYAAQLFELKQYGNIYTRINNPTTAVFEERMAALANGVGAVATASGMSAELVAMMTMLEPGDEVVASSHLYGGTRTLFTHTFDKLSVEAHFVEPNDHEAWDAAITDDTKALYAESVGNPQGSVLDFEPLVELADHHGLPLVVDNTFCTPYLCRPVDWGVPVVVQSATKFLGGHGNSIGGVIVDGGSFDFNTIDTVAEPSESYHGLEFPNTFGHQGYLMKARAETLRDTGASLSPFNAFMLIQGLETLSVRMERHVSNAQAVAEHLDEHPMVGNVAYPGLPDNPYHDLAQKYMPKGPGAIFTFELSPDGPDPRAAGETFIENLQLFSHLANVGDARSLVLHPASTTHQQLSEEEMRSSGITPGMIRLSIGLEDTDDLLWDLDQALHAISQ